MCIKYFHLNQKQSSLFVRPPPIKSDLNFTFLKGQIKEYLDPDCFIIYRPAAVHVRLPLHIPLISQISLIIEIVLVGSTVGTCLFA